MVHEVSRTEELAERRRTHSVDHAGLEVEEHRAWYVCAARGPTHKRTELHASVWGSEFTTKAATLQRVHLNSCSAFVYVGLGPVITRHRVLVHEVLYRGAQAVVRGGAHCASQVLDRGAMADVRGGAQVLDRGAQAVARGAARCAPQVILIVVPGRCQRRHSLCVTDA